MSFTENLLSFIEMIFFVLIFLATLNQEIKQETFLNPTENDKSILKISHCQNSSCFILLNYQEVVQSYQLRLNAFIYYYDCIFFKILTHHQVTSVVKGCEYLIEINRKLLCELHSAESIIYPEIYFAIKALDLFWNNQVESFIEIISNKNILCNNVPKTLQFQILECYLYVVKTNFKVIPLIIAETVSEYYVQKIGITINFSRKFDTSIREK